MGGGWSAKEREVERPNERSSPHVLLLFPSPPFPSFRQTFFLPQRSSIKMELRSTSRSKLRQRCLRSVGREIKVEGVRSADGADHRPSSFLSSVSMKQTAASYLLCSSRNRSTYLCFGFGFWMKEASLPSYFLSFDKGGETRAHLVSLLIFFQAASTRSVSTFFTSCFQRASSWLRRAPTVCLGAIRG